MFYNRMIGSFTEDAYVIQGGLADGVILDTQHLHHLLHLTEHLGQGDIL